MDEIVLTQEMVLDLLPDRLPNSHKGNYGRVLVIAGSLGYTGAPSLAAQGALRCGAGLVTLLVPKTVYSVVAGKMMEAMVFPLPAFRGKLSGFARRMLKNHLLKADVVLVGPGLGRSSGVDKVVYWVLKNFSGPVVLDADGINALSGHMDILRGRTAPTILTPHPGEFARVGGQLSEGRIAAAVNFAKDNGCVLVLKGHNTVITDGVQLYCNPTGNPGMAVGGSGDVLAGVVAAFIGQGLSAIDAAACGAWVHGTAGDLCAKEIGQYGMLPTDMLSALPRLLK